MNTLTAKVQEGLYYLGVNDRDTRLFENIWPLPRGIAYNAYLIVDEKTCLLDTVRANKTDGFMEGLKTCLDGRDLDYLVINHLEPDHAGSIRPVLQNYPNLTFIGNAKTKQMLEEMLDIETTEENFIVVKEGDTLSLGERVLNFAMTPMVHWPESMVTYESTGKVLFSQDIFGGYGTLNGTIFDDQMNYDFFVDEYRRYYSNIVGKYSQMAIRALQKVEKLDIDIICPVHGCVWRKNPEKIIGDYAKWAAQEVDGGVIIIYGSMYGTTEGMADTLARFVAEEGIRNVKVFDCSKTHSSYLLSQVWKYKGLVLGSTTYNNAVYPNMEYFLNILRMNKIKNHALGIFGNYSWSGGAVKDLKTFMDSQSFDNCETVVESKGAMTEEIVEQLRQLAKEIAEKSKVD